MSKFHRDQWDSTAALLVDHSAPECREAVWTQALAFINAGHHDDAHLVASVLVVESDGRVLFARHRRYGQWGPIGGHSESGDASLSTSAARELLEEAVLVARVHPAPIDVRLSSCRCRTATEPGQRNSSKQGREHNFHTYDERTLTSPRTLFEMAYSSWQYQ